MASVAWLVSNVKTNEHEELWNTELASSRMRAGVCISGCLKAGLPVLPLNYRDAGHDPDLVFMAKYVPDSNTAQFLDDSGARWAFWLEKVKRLHARGKHLVIDYTDNHFTNPNIVGDFYRTIKPMVTGLVVPSTRMQRHLEGNWSGPLEIIPEPVEVAMQPTREYKGGEKIALWFGHNSNLPYLFEFMRTGMKEAPPNRLVILTNHILKDAVQAAVNQGPKGLQVTLAKWSVETMLKAAAACHYAIVPSNTEDDRKNGASPGRLLTSLAMGLPVVATPLESYQPFSTYFASIGTPQAKALMERPQDFADRIAPAQTLIRERFTVEAIGAQWASYARRLLGV